MMTTAVPLFELEKLLFEDCPYGDLTALALGLDATPARMRFVARETTVLSAVEEAAAVLRLCGATIQRYAPSGTTVQTSDEILCASGAATALHRGWRVAQVLIETWSGVASAVSAIVRAVRAVNPAVHVACTRKMVPGTRALAVAAVRAGGGAPHRLGLSESILVFPQHRALLADRDIRQAVARMRARAPEQKVTIEVTGIADATAAAEAGCDIIQVDKRPAMEVSAIVRHLRAGGHRTLIAAAGGVTLATAAAYAAAGVDIIVTSAPYSAAPADVAVTFEPLTS